MNKYDILSKIIPNMNKKDINNLCNTNKEFYNNCEEYYKHKNAVILKKHGKSYKDIYNTLTENYIVLFINDFSSKIIGFYNNKNDAIKIAKEKSILQMDLDDPEEVERLKKRIELINNSTINSNLTIDDNNEFPWKDDPNFVIGISPFGDNINNIYIVLKLNIFKNETLNEDEDNEEYYKNKVAILLKTNSKSQKELYNILTENYIILSDSSTSSIDDAKSKVVGFYHDKYEAIITAKESGKKYLIENIRELNDFDTTDLKYIQNRVDKNLAIKEGYGFLWEEDPNFIIGFSPSGYPLNTSFIVLKLHLFTNITSATKSVEIQMKMLDLINQYPDLPILSFISRHINSLAEFGPL